MVAVTSFPLYAMATEIAGNAATVDWATNTGRSSRHWEPSADDVRSLQSADLILLSGAGYEPWTGRLSLPRSRTVDTSSDYADRLLRVDGSITHQHGPQGSGSARTFAWATWLNPELAMAQLRRVEQELCRLLPEQIDVFSRRATAMASQLQRNHERLQDMVQKTGQGREDSRFRRRLSVVTDCPACSYVASDLNWAIHSIKEFAGDPDEQLAAAIETFAPHLLMFRQDGPAGVRTLFENSAVPGVAIDVCEHDDGRATLVTRLTGNISRLRTAIDQLQHGEAPPVNLQCSLRDGSFRRTSPSVHQLSFRRSSLISLSRRTVHSTAGRNLPDSSISMCYAILRPGPALTHAIVRN